MSESSYDELKEKVLYILKFRNKYLTLKVFFFGNILFSFTAIFRIPVMFLVFFFLMFMLGLYLLSTYRCRILNCEPFLPYLLFILIVILNWIFSMESTSKNSNLFMLCFLNFLMMEFNIFGI